MRTICRGQAWVFIVSTLATLASPLPIRAQERQKHVLVLYSTGPETQIALLGDREFPRILHRNLGARVDYYTEHLDAGRFSDPRYRAGFRDFLRLKYNVQRFDVVIAMLDVAVEFLQEYRDDLFPGSPVVFFATRPLARSAPNFTGLISRTRLDPTLTLATSLQPDTKQVFVVSGAGVREKQYEAIGREQFRMFEPRLTFTYLSGLPTTELERRLAVLPEQSVIFYLLVYEDGAGEKFLPIEYLERLAAVASRPIYSWVDSAMDHGVVGGATRLLQSEIEAVTDRAIQVLRGKPADEIPTSSSDLFVNQVDWRQLRRWGISERGVPTGSLVRFRELSAWDRYKWHILAAVALVLAQSVLIAGLLLQAARWRRAEKVVKKSQAELRDSYQRIRDLGRRVLTAQEAERSRVARELHDDVSQQLALLAIDLQLLGNAGSESETDMGVVAQGALVRTQGLVKSVHALSHALHPARLHLLGLVGAIASLQRELSGSGMAVTFAHDDVPSGVPPDLALCVYRVVQEALRNAMKHSASDSVSVRLGCNQEELILTIADEGVGFDMDAVASKGIGIVSMRERVEAFGGILTIQSKAGRGTRLEVSLPLPPAGVIERQPRSVGRVA